MPTLVAFAPSRVRESALAGSGHGGLIVAVRNTLSRPVARAPVNIDDVGTQFTDSLGIARFESIPAGPRRVLIYADGLWSQTLTVQIAAGFRDSVRTYLASGRLGIPCGVQ